ncbi:ABC transporter permease [Mesorhizobium shangrilense]|uniref:ABC transporter permease n=1 Tax=Mesorhizobium shangrilense TaxID=460060 RepID=A0ABV2DSV1_9HYPH
MMPFRALGRYIDRPSLIAVGVIVLLLLVGSFYSSNFISPTYLLQQLQIGAFLGIIAIGVLMVVLLGHVDLSIPWVVTMGGMMATAAGNLGPGGTALAIPFALLCGLIVGTVNGLGVAVLRIPSMIFTLGVNAVVQGLMVLYTGGYAPQDRATGLMQWLAGGRILGVPNATLVWILLAILAGFILRLTPLGRYIFAIGNRERAAYLSGVDTRLVLIFSFAAAGMCSALAGVMLAGYSRMAYQAMGDPYLLPAIAGVVIGGANVLGGRGTVLGTVIGSLLITILLSMLSVMQVPDSARQIAYGVIIIVMMLISGREMRTSA